MKFFLLLMINQSILSILNRIDVHTDFALYYEIVESKINFIFEFQNFEYIAVGFEKNNFIDYV